MKKYFIYGSRYGLPVFFLITTFLGMQEAANLSNAGHYFLAAPLYVMACFLGFCHTMSFAKALDSNV